jgi:hypothetical protein
MAKARRGATPRRGHSGRPAELRKRLGALRVRVEADERHVTSPTAVAMDMLRSGTSTLAGRRRRTEIPHEDERIRVGDPDDSALANEYVGEDTPGGSTPTPDQNDVDEIGRAYGLVEEDTGALRTAEEVLSRRDRRRPELQPPGRPRT